MNSGTEHSDTAQYTDKAYVTPEAELVHPDRQSGTSGDKLFSKKGRLGVKAYCSRMLWVLPPLGVCLAVMFEFPRFEHRLNDVHAAIVIGGILAVVGLFIALLVVYLCTSIKRLHDLGHSGWLVLFSGLPIVGTIFSIYYSFTPSTDAVNQYGNMREPDDGKGVTGTIGAILLGIIFMFALVDSGTSIFRWLAR